MSDNYPSWIGVDLDGTIAEYHSGDFDKHGPLYIGPPIPAMVQRVKHWLAEGKTVKIFTARIFDEYFEYLDFEECPDSRVWPVRDAIHDWCEEHIGEILPVTCMKDPGMVELWDDRAVSVGKNNGSYARA